MQEHSQLLQLCVLRLDLLQDGDVRVGVFQDNEELLGDYGSSTSRA